jgi:hypothetical protein
MIDNDISLLGDPFFEEKGKIVSHRVLSVEPEVQIEYVIFLHGIMNGNLGVTDSGTLVSTLRRLTEYTTVKDKE